MTSEDLLTYVKAVSCGPTVILDGFTNGDIVVAGVKLPRGTHLEAVQSVDSSGNDVISWLEQGRLWTRSGEQATALIKALGGHSMNLSRG